MEAINLRQTSTIIENCCRSILQKMKGDVDPKRHEKLKTECQKFGLNDIFISRLLFVNEERANKRKYIRKTESGERSKRFLN